MKLNYFFLLTTISFLILAGCTSQNSPSETSTSNKPETEDNNLSEKKSANQKESITLTDVLTEVSNVSGLSNSDKMRLRRKVDDVSLSDEGEGFSLRLSSDNPELSQKAEVINQILKKLGFTVAESTPKNPQSFVIKFVKYEKDDLVCTLEIRKIGTTGESELAFGCIE